MENMVSQHGTDWLITDYGDSLGNVVAQLRKCGVGYVVGHKKYSATVGLGWLI
jgi:hypothetical protein